MGEDKRELLRILTAELEYLKRGGYRRHSWRPQYVFEDSPTCVNYHDPNKLRPCSECKLMQFVPLEFRDANIPCRHIPFNIQGDTLALLYGMATQEELEETVACWLETTIARLRKGLDNPELTDDCENVLPESPTNSAR